MRRRAFLLGLAGSFACTARPASASDAVDPAASPPAAPLGLDRRSGYRLIKDWDFRTSIRDLDRLRSEFHTRLIYANGTLDHLNDEWSRYRDNDNHVFTPEGLALRANLKGALQPGNIETGMLRSRWTGQYGVYEISMKVPRGRGLWPAFWLNPEDLTWPPEIDVVEIVTDGPLGTRRSYHYLHSKNVKELPCSVSKLGADKAYTPGFDYADGFHVFAVEWTPEIREAHGRRRSREGLRVSLDPQRRSRRGTGACPHVPGRGGPLARSAPGRQLSGEHGRRIHSRMAGVARPPSP